MIHLDVPQGGRKWIYARLGRPTASQFHRLVTPKTMKPSGAQDEYLNDLLAEWLTGEVLDDSVTQFMERGRQEEERAVLFYEALRDLDTELAGFCLTDDERAGASPDRFVGTDGLVEIKTPSAATHVHYIRALRNGGPSKYHAQLQGQLLVTERQWVDFVSFHPTIKPVVLRYERDEAFLKVLAEQLAAFCDRLDAEKAAFVADGYEPVMREG